MQVAERLDGEEEEARRRIERIEIGMTPRNLPPVGMVQPEAGARMLQHSVSTDQRLRQAGLVEEILLVAEIDRPVTRSDLRRLRQMGFGERVVAVMPAGQMKLTFGLGGQVAAVVESSQIGLDRASGRRRTMANIDNLLIIIEVYF
jgi:hypothetical protein